MSTSFFHTLAGGAYDSALGWLCHPLTVSGARVEELRIGGSSLSPELYKVDPPYIRLIAPPPSNIPDAIIKIRIQANKSIDTPILVALIGLVGVMAVPIINGLIDRTHYDDKGKKILQPRGQVNKTGQSGTQPSPIDEPSKPNPPTTPASPKPTHDDKQSTMTRGSSIPKLPEKSQLTVTQKPAAAAPPHKPIPVPITYQEALRLKDAGEYALALEQFEALARGGNPKAQYQLGNMYLLGLGCPKDVLKAIPWLQRAADAQIAQAQHNLGVIYQRGDGVAKDDDRAMDLFTSAAKNGWEPSKAILKEAGRPF